MLKLLLITNLLTLAVASGALIFAYQANENAEDASSYAHMAYSEASE